MAGAPQQQQNTDNSLALLWGIVCTFVVISISWIVFHDAIVSWVLRLRLVEARLIATIFPKAQDWVTHLQLLSPQQVNFSDLASISTVLGRYLRFPISMILLSFSVLIYLGQVTLRFKRHYDMQTLAELEQQNWSQITPILSLNLVNTPLDMGPWAMALTPFQFAQENDLLVWGRVPSLGGGVAMVVSSEDWKVKLKREEARRRLAFQLGPKWQGVGSLSMPAKALFAIFAARSVRDKDIADQLLEQLAQSAIPQAHWEAADYIACLNFKGVDSILNKYTNHPLIQRVTKKHAYVLGVMASMLKLARQDGVLASADFLWLKPCDRLLWFMLNCIGRQTAYTEVAAPFAHWVAECVIGHPLKTPMVDAAVDALDAALRDVRLPADSKEK